MMYFVAYGRYGCCLHRADCVVVKHRLVIAQRNTIYPPRRVTWAGPFASVLQVLDAMVEPFSGEAMTRLLRDGMANRIRFDTCGRCMREWEWRQRMLQDEWKRRLGDWSDWVAERPSQHDRV